MKKREGERATRSDKKREVKPSIKTEAKDAVYRLAFITVTPVKDVSEQLCKYVMNDKRIIDHYSQYFQRDVVFDKTMFFGNSSNPSIPSREKGETGRVTIKFTQTDYNKIAAISYALDCTPSRTVAILLSTAMNNIEFVNRYVKIYLNERLSESQMNELHALLKYVNRTTSNEPQEQHSWPALLGAILDEVMTPVHRVKDAVNEYLLQLRREE